LGNNQCSRTATPCAGATPDRIHALTNVEVITGATAIGLEGHDGMLQAVRWRLSTTGRKSGNRSATCFHLSVPRPIPTGSTDQASLSIRKVSFSPATMPVTAVIYWGLCNRRCAGKIGQACSRGGRRGPVCCSGSARLLDGRLAQTYVGIRA
jgi:hypothetical protein